MSNRRIQEHWTASEYKKYLENKKESKYKAIRTTVDGKKFDSMKEAEFYNNLKFRLQGKDIKGYCLQPIFILAEDLVYRPDFIIFNNDGTYEIIDVKGYKTPTYLIKKKVFEEKYNLKIKEV